MSRTAATSFPGLLSPSPQQRATPDASRRAGARRVQLLIIAVVLMGLGDLACTVIYMTHIGLLEMNPLARFMIEIGGLRQLVVFKLGSMALSCGCLYLTRYHRRTEQMAWVCAVILLLLTVHWMRYNAEIPGLTHEIGVIALSEPSLSAKAGWVTLVD